MRYNDLEDMVHRRELTCNEFLDIIDRKYIAASTTGYTLLLGISDLSDLTLMLNSSPPIEVNVHITTDDIGLGSNLTSNKELKFTEKNLFPTPM